MSLFFLLILSNSSRRPRRCQCCLRFCGGNWWRKSFGEIMRFLFFYSSYYSFSHLWTSYLDYLREEFKEWMPINEIERDLKVKNTILLLCFFLPFLTCLFLQIHATIINTKSRKDSGGERGRGRGRGRGGGRGRGRRQGVDCRQIFSSFGSHFFGEFSLKSVHLSQRHEFGPDGYWKHLNIVNLP